MNRSPNLASRVRLPLLAAVAFLAVAWGLAERTHSANATDPKPAAPVWSEGALAEWSKPREAELQATLTELQYRVTQQEGTEPPFRNEFWNHKEHGLYVDIVSGEPLFSSLDKYKSGTGWPSFVRALEPNNITEQTDHKLGYPRTEVRSKVADSHLGHLFPDGPEPTGDRYCINSAALRFVPVERLALAGYGSYVAAFEQAGIEVTTMTNADSPNREVALLAGGCYWGMEDLFRTLPGVLDTEVGFAGGDFDNPTYEDVGSKNTGHAETLQIVFDPTKVSFAQLLDRFFRIHDPTTVDRQGNDRGSQYRSAIFYKSEAQKSAAKKVIAEWNASGRWKAPIATEITEAGSFWPAKESHQDYLVKNPNGYTCHFEREFSS